MTTKECCCLCSEKDIESAQNISPKVRSCVKNLIKSEGFLSFEVTVHDISTGGGNYLGILQEVDIKGNTERDSKEISLFVKNCISGEEFTALSVNEIYSREAFVYNELFKIFDTLQAEANVPTEERFKSVKCYSESNSEVIILENLSRKGYKTGHRLSTIGIEFAEKSVKQIAKFHALSAVLHEKNPEYFDTHIKSLESLVSIDSEWEQFIRNVCDTAVKYLNGELKRKIEDFCPLMIQKYKTYQSPLEADVSFLCHGDFRTNNILIKENGEISDVVIVDYQLVYHGKPILDFFYFIFSATDQIFRAEHLENLKELYYNTMGNFMRYFDINIEDVYPRKKFEDDYVEKLDYGLMTFLTISPFIFATNDSVPELKGSVSALKCEMDDNYKERLQGIVNDYIHWGIL